MYFKLDNQKIYIQKCFLIFVASTSSPPEISTPTSPPTITNVTLTTAQTSDARIANATNHPSSVTSSPTSLSKTTHFALTTALPSDAPIGNTTSLSSVTSSLTSTSTMTFVAPTTAQTSADDLPPSTVKLQLTNNPQIRTTLALPTTTADGAPSTVQTSDNPTGTTPATNAPSYSSTTKENPTTYTSATDATRRSIATSTASNTITSTQGILYRSTSIAKNPLPTHLNFPQGVPIIFRSFFL